MLPGNSTQLFSRYQRQMILPHLGEAAQRRLAASRVLIVGCGAVGSVAAEQLARAGVGFVRIADRDVVEMTNLQRQVLFDEADARENRPKAIAAARRLARINSSIRIEPLVVDVDAENIERLIDVDLIIDGTDNVETRYLINDVAVKHNRPWIYGACVGTEGRVMTIMPGETPCLRCIFPNPPTASELPTCDTAGVLGPAAAVVGAMQAAEAIKILSENSDAARPGMLTIDLWVNRYRSLFGEVGKRDDCPCCALRRFEFLDNPKLDRTTRLCGRDAVQIHSSRSQNGISLETLASKLSALRHVRRTEHLIRASLGEGIELTAFNDGRVIIHGTGDVARARSIYARFIGS